MAIIQKIADNIDEYGSLSVATQHFEIDSKENDILRYSLPVYNKTATDKGRRTPQLLYDDADLCLFQLTDNEAEPLVCGKQGRHAPNWWLIGTDDLRENGLTLMEFPAPNEPEEAQSWTRSAVLDTLGLAAWQPISSQQARDLDYDTGYRLSGRIGIKRNDPDEYIEGCQKSGIDIDWDDIERLREPAATRIASHLLSFADASDFVQTFDPQRVEVEDNGRWIWKHIYESAYIPESESVCVISDQYRNRSLVLAEGIYSFWKLGLCRRHATRHPSYDPPNH